MVSSRATLKDVAIKSGYALRTVKKVMSGNENVRTKTRISVLNAAKELNYQRNIAASVLSRRKSVQVAIVYAEVSEGYFPEVERGFMQCAKELRDFGLSIEFHKAFVQDVDAQVDALKRLAADESVDGVIIQPVSSSQLNSHIDDFINSGRPLLTFGADAPLSKRLAYIGPDAYRSGRIGAQILANYIGKRGNVVVISSNFEHSQTKDRISGFQDRVKEHYPKINVKSLHVPTFEPKAYYEFVRTLVCAGEPVRGIFATNANSYIAGEVLRDLRRDDIIVVGFDISNMATEIMKEGYLKVLIEQNPFQIAYLTLKAMFNRIYLNEQTPPIQHTPLSIVTSECL